MARYNEAEAFDYYVVRHKETGQYFRGKGVNKWGKYFNQASIYRIKKHAENAVEEEARRGNPAEVVKLRITEVRPELDDYKLNDEVTKAKRAAMYAECCKYDGCDKCPHTDGLCNHHCFSDAPPEIIDKWYKEMFGNKKVEE